MKIARIINTLYPPTCVLCHGPGKNNLDLCSGCYADLPYHTDLNYKNYQLPQIDRCITSLRYADPAAYLIKGLKFKEKLAYGHILSHILAERLVLEFILLKSLYKQHIIPFPQCIIPVPLHPIRLKERGFNQTQEIAKIPARMLQLPIETKSCVRALATRPQTELTREQRLHNLRGAFAVTAKMPTCVAIVDDVITTGTTVSELAQTLRAAGVQYIHAWAVAHAGD